MIKMLSRRLDYGDFFVRMYTLFSGGAIALGAVILTGGENRFSSPGFKGPRDLVSVLPGDAYVWWGMLFALYGLAMVIALGRTKTAVHVLRFGIVVFAFLAIAFLRSVLHDPMVAATGVVIYSVISLAFALMSDHLAHKGWGA